MSSILSLNRVCKSYSIGSRVIPILKEISLDIAVGEFLAIMGPSGSGKSTLLHIMSGLDHASSGQVHLNGKDISQLNDEELAHHRNQSMGFVFQSFFLLNYYTALENVCLPLHYGGVFEEKKEAAQQLLINLGLKDRMDHRPQELSGGERQRVAIARALVNNPPLIFADEPTGNLDTHTGSSILDILTRINQLKTTVVLITHDPRVAERARRTIQIEDGNLK